MLLYLMETVGLEELFLINIVQLAMPLMEMKKQHQLQY
jgi:hypothetical protein